MRTSYRRKSWVLVAMLTLVCLRGLGQQAVNHTGYVEGAAGNNKQYRAVRHTSGDNGDATLQSGDYYLRNKATGQWIAGGGHWGTEAVLASHPCMVHAQKLGGGIYQLTTEFFNPDNGLNGLGIAEGRMYVECTPELWTIEAAAQEGFFTIACTDGFLGSDGGKLVYTLQDAEADEAQWQLLTLRQMVEELLSGHATDATFLISNPRFDRNHDRGNWEGSNFAVGGEDGQYNVGNHCAEVWNSNFDVYQTLQNLPNGRYRLQAQGYYRYNNVWDNNTNYNAYTARNNGTEKLYARIYADGGNGEAETPLQSIVSERDNIAALGIWVNQSRYEGYGMPFSMAEAANTFTAGLYSDVRQSQAAAGWLRLDHLGQLRADAA